MSYHDNIDAAAEREGASLDFFAVELGQEPHPRLATEREMRFCASARAVPGPSSFRYCRRKAVIRWLRILDAMRAGKPAPLSRPVWDTRDDRRRYVERRATRLAMLRENRRRLARMSQNATVPLPDAIRLAGLSERTIFRAKKCGVLPTVYDGRKPTFRVRDLRRFIDDYAARRVHIPQ